MIIIMNNRFTFIKNFFYFKIPTDTLKVILKYNNITLYQLISNIKKDDPFNDNYNIL